MKEERFTELLAKKLSGEITPDEHVEFNRLIASDPSFQKEYESIRSYWVQDDEPLGNMVNLLEKIKQRAGIIAEENPVGIIELNPPKSRLWLRIFSAAGIAIFVLSVCFYFFKINNHKNTLSASLTELKTKNGLISKIKLADGTWVTLNAVSTLSYPKYFIGKTREVFLDGEAFFDVAKDHNHPFIVHTSKSDIRVLGTAFDIKSYTDEPFEATLFRGSIQAIIKGGHATNIIL